MGCEYEKGVSKNVVFSSRLIRLVLSLPWKVKVKRKQGATILFWFRLLSRVVEIYGKATMPVFKEGFLCRSGMSSHIEVGNGVRLSTILWALIRQSG